MVEDGRKQVYEGVSGGKEDNNKIKNLATNEYWEDETGKWPTNNVVSINLGPLF
jgi:hypothetical protein